ncbi:MAG: hypothetical protein JJT82_01075 [Legionellaceae bacterium]|nr:hypothetical protein [Legionellaceae bacterium]
MMEYNAYFFQSAHKNKESTAVALGKVLGAGTLLLLATSAFVYDLGLPLGLHGTVVPSAVVGWSLAAAALALLVPHDTPAAAAGIPHP